jgi:hypothetical protein
MAAINHTSGNENQNFKQIEGDSWSNIYLPAICAGVVMTIVLLMAVSCSKKSEDAKAKIAAPAAPAVETPAPNTTTAAVSQTPKKLVKKHRPASATYVNSTYGVVFSYPRKYSLQSGDKEKGMPLESAFAKPGAVEIVSVDMPDGGYPDTDFSSALLNLSVLPNVNADDCAQFVQSKDETTSGAHTDANAIASDTPKIGEEKPTTAKVAAIKLGANQFTEMEKMKGTGERQSDVKYFHLFKNGACYEFALDVETSRRGDEDLAQVDRGQVFKQLEKILTTARVKDVDVPGVVNAGKSLTTPTVISDATSENSEKAQVVTPADQK